MGYISVKCPWCGEVGEINLAGDIRIRPWQADENMACMCEGCGRWFGVDIHWVPQSDGRTERIEVPWQTE